MLINLKNAVLSKKQKGRIFLTLRKNAAFYVKNALGRIRTYNQRIMSPLL
jgi:hypothetical protein